MAEILLWDASVVKLVHVYFIKVINSLSQNNVEAGLDFGNIFLVFGK